MHNQINKNCSDNCNNMQNREKHLILNLEEGPNTSKKSSVLNTPRTPHRAILTPKTPPVTPDSPFKYKDDDLDSLQSYGSTSSMMSCDHYSFPRNGTTYSGRKQKYVFHSSAYTKQPGNEYLTPTQRAQKHIKKLRELLAQARLDLEQKDSEVIHLTKEVVELRLFKASLSSPEDKSNSSEAITVKENANSSNDASPIVDMIVKSSYETNSPNIYCTMIDKLCLSEMHSSFADSGHFEDTTSSVHSKDICVSTREQGTSVDCLIDEDRQALIEMYERKIEELIKFHDTDKQEISAKHNDKIEALLQKLSECNSRFSNIVPDYEEAKTKVRELEFALETLQKKLAEQEDKANKMYLHMFAKDQDNLQMVYKKKAEEAIFNTRVSVPQIVEQLRITHAELQCLEDPTFMSDTDGASPLLSAKEAISLWLLGAKKEMYSRLMEAQQNKAKIDPDVKLQFLKSAVFYFLTTLDKEASEAHLNVIESLLDFSESEKQHISRIRNVK